LEKKLRILYALQLVDSALDELEELKGDLPAETRELQERKSQLETARAARELEMRKTFAARDEADNGILSFREKLEKYKKQQHEVRNNKEYDALTREIDYAGETIRRLEKEMETLEGKAVAAKDDIASLSAQVEEINKLLGEKLVALEEISKSNETEELKYKHEREKLIVRVEKSDLGVYDRIRKANKGRAIVPVRRGACGGCFAKVPPQRLLELRLNDRIYQCEHCGRIIVSDEIVENTSSVA
jgi:predicted  nucleic acid-binding Zn-ribbon protein